jgi:LPPG:FO 2-phospho-L-lactate transferase
VVEALRGGDLIIIAPSNPFVSIGPILAVEEIRIAIADRKVPAVAVSPLIGGRAVKGPADRMMRRLAGGTGPEQVASCYERLIDALVYDEADGEVELEVRPIVTQTLMTDAASRRRLAEAALEAAAALR